ncbi:MAG: redox-sensitive transcriptional activator SoxR [Granulosicoccus sp.]
MHKRDPFISIGQLSQRTGLAVSAIRFYEAQGLIDSTRSSGGQRRFKRHCIRRLSFIIIAQQLGFPLNDIRTQLDSLPANRTPTKKDWDRLANSFKKDINRRIEGLIDMRDKLSSCIGCGCLSLKSCHLYNPDDRAERLGGGPRFLLGDNSSMLDDMLDVPT